MGKIVLQVGNVPSNRQALTNKVYVSPKVYGYLVEAQGPERQGSGPLVTVGPHVYVAEGNAAVPEDKIALNGLQRRFAQLSLANRVEVRPFVPPPNYALATLEIEVDLLQKKAAGKGSPPREIDTDRLASDFLLNYEGMVFEVGQTLARRRQGFLPASDAGDGEAFLPEVVLDQFQDVALVVDDEDVLVGHGHQSISPCRPIIRTSC